MSSSPIDGGVVLITGASSGIGREMARLIAHRAKTIVLVARRKERLEELSAELRKTNPALEVVVYACDLAAREALATLIDEVTRDVGAVDVLVNNAGLGDQSIFDKSDLKKQLFMIDLNVAALVQLTHAFVSGMVERGRGAILNVSSGFGLSYIPSMSTYIGTKHFVTGFTESLHADLAGTGVLASQLCPGPVATEFEEVAGNFTGQKVPAFVELDAVACARAGIRAIDGQRAMVVPHYLIWFLLWWLRFVPRWLVRVFLRPVGRRLRKLQTARHSAPAVSR